MLRYGMNERHMYPIVFYFLSVLFQRCGGLALEDAKTYNLPSSVVTSMTEQCVCIQHLHENLCVSANQIAFVVSFLSPRIKKKGNSISHVRSKF